MFMDLNKVTTSNLFLAPHPNENPEQPVKW